MWTIKRIKSRHTTTVPCSEQKNPCWHLEQVCFDDASGAGAGAGTWFFGGAGFASTGFSVVCLPVLHLH